MAIHRTAKASGFVDTNVWLYAFVQTQGAAKNRTAKRLIQDPSAIVTSTQVINEVCINLLRKFNFNETDIQNMIAAFYSRYRIVELNQLTLQKASELRSRHRFSFWDSIVAASALLGGASILYTEDMHDGLVIDQRLKVENPFK